MNTAVHETTSFSPFELMFGRNAILPVELEMEERDVDVVLEQYMKRNRMMFNFLLIITLKSFNLHERIS